ncbi:hypothetical protein DUNSADRAFT_6657 [Dunaliella salina]|uniref:Helicase C-terminal domain-containing protein n=1 Tax=Dunaliella salina TaxID=3046 RepID=A0ABQ7GMV8_DUNSA|nr:hypothetical protein DUNSADRAFT_6657 [Dunaliella salina]|eukprot:KAF5835946.1 hypothetical protein DUNSADRAFT_6657 [Dunaliella salina]
MQMYKLASDLGKALFSAARSSGSDDCADAIGSFVAQLPPAEKVWINQTHSYNLLCLWLRKAIQLAASWKLFQFGVGVELLEALRKAAALSEDMGYECGIRYVLEMLVMKTLKSRQKRGALAACKKAVPNTGSLAAHPGQRQSTSTGATGSEQASLAALRAYIHHGPSPAEKQAAMNGNAAAAAANRMGLEGLLAMEPCPDVYPGCVLSMAQKIIAAVQEYADGLGPQKFGFAAGTGSSCLPAAVVRPFLPGGLQRPPATFWKLWSLLQCLHEYSSADNLHAIIFTRTRQGANHLAKALQNAMRCGPRGTQAGNCDASAGTSGAEANAILLRPAAVHVLVGHGEGRVNAKRLPHEMVLEQHVEEEDEEDGEEEGSSSGRGHGLSLHNDQHGMSVAQQRAVVDAFKAGGRNLLVATTAAEEGLDVPSCELVLRYSPPASGTQQVQSRGRGRKEDARYVCLVQNGGVDVGGGSDHALHYKSKQEEAVLRLGLRSNSTKQGFLS